MRLFGGLKYWADAAEDVTSVLKYPDSSQDMYGVDYVDSCINYPRTVRARIMSLKVEAQDA